MSYIYIYNKCTQYTHLYYVHKNLYFGCDQSLPNIYTHTKRVANLTKMGRIFLDKTFVITDKNFTIKFLVKFRFTFNTSHDIKPRNWTLTFIKKIIKKKMAKNTKIRHIHGMCQRIHTQSQEMGGVFPVTPQGPSASSLIKCTHYKCPLKMSMRLVLFEVQRQENLQLSGTVKIGWEERRECDRGGGEGTERAGLSWVFRMS